MRRGVLSLIIFSFLMVTLFLVYKNHRPLAGYFSRKNEKKYTKKEVYIKMRDGTRLYTAIYRREGEGKQPIIFIRTPYSAGSYGTDSINYSLLGYLCNYVKENYIIVIQDVRGKFMSGGEFEDIRPYIPNKQGAETDEASDTYDSIDWLVKNIPDNNNKVGMIGISYPGFYAALGGLCGHPALKAISPQAPIGDWFIGDDIHHNGAFMLMDAVNLFNSFGKHRNNLTKVYPGGLTFPCCDNYKFYMDIGTLKNLAVLMGDSIKFWKDIYNHPDYDDYWKERNVAGEMQYMPPGVASLVVGGMFDAEDCYGALKLYRAIDSRTGNNCKLVMGPWSHAAWSVSDYDHLGNIRFGQKVSEWYQKNIELPFFDYYLRDKGDLKTMKKSYVFFTGINEWRALVEWPPKQTEVKPMYLHSDGALAYSLPLEDDNHGYNHYISDPDKPVPYSEDMNFKRTKEYMDDDQRFAARRPDVLVYETDTLTNEVSLAGPLVADLFTAISTTDADFVVKLIDVFPDKFAYNDTIDGKGNGKDYKMGGYQMLVRGEVMRGRYRGSFEKPEAFTPNRITEVKYELPDVAHVFKKGHRIMVQLQSSWFPLTDRNPQQFLDIYHSDNKDFISSKITIYCSAVHPSKILLPILSKSK